MDFGDDDTLAMVNIRHVFLFVGRSINSMKLWKLPVVLILYNIVYDLRIGL